MTTAETSKSSDKTDLSPFFSDWQHESSDIRPAQYTAYAVRTYHCGACGLQLKREGWPQYCARGHRNEKPESPL